MIILFSLCAQAEESAFKQMLLERGGMAADSQDKKKADVNFLIPQIEYSSKDTRDPFADFLPEEAKPKSKPAMAAAAASVSLPKVDLSGIIWQGRIPQAIIDEKIVTIGDTVGGAEITNIDKEGVEFLYEGGVFKVPSPARVSQEKWRIKTGGGSI